MIEKIEKTEKHFTATTFIIEREKILLIFHKKLSTWLPPGGHVDPNETPVEGAIREVKEETGLEIELLPQENLWIDCPEASSFARPYLCLLENIPSNKNTPAHQHIDFIYLARLLSQENQKTNESEIQDLRWFSLEEIECSQEILPNVKEILLHIFSKFVTKDPLAVSANSYGISK